jgi:hypothetical protein
MMEISSGREGRRRRWIVPASLGALIVVIALVWFLAPRFRMQEYASFAHPDGDFTVVVLRYPQWKPAMPGQGGDAPGVVRLYDEEGNLQNEARVEMVQLVDQVDWEADTVRIKSVAAWPLTR